MDLSANLTLFDLICWFVIVINIFSNGCSELFQFSKGICWRLCLTEFHKCIHRLHIAAINLKIFRYIKITNFNKIRYTFLNPQNSFSLLTIMSHKFSNSRIKFLIIMHIFLHKILYFILKTFNFLRIFRWIYSLIRFRYFSE